MANPLEGEHKQVTVLFCDIANSMTLAETLGPEGMHALLNEFFAIALREVRAYEGTVNQFLGDGIMALFGAPVAHEEHERLAMLAALAIERAVARRAERTPLLVRMGLNTGPVVVGGVGDSDRTDYTAVGDTTNFAARLQQAAEPGSILVSEAIAARADASFVLEAVPGLEIKGRREPVTAYRLRGRRQRGRGIALERSGRSLSPFVGRDHELAMIRGAFAKAQGGRGQVVAILGDAGAGKSRLVTETHRALAGPDVAFLEGQCLSYGTLVPYLPIVDVLRELCGVTEGDGAAAIAEGVRAALERAGLDVATNAPYLSRLLGVDDARAPIEGLSPETIKARTFDILRHLVLTTSTRAPMILVLENLHWIDRISEEFVGLLIDAVAGARVLVLATYRPGYRPRWIDKSYATQIGASPLARDQSAAIVRAVASAEPLEEGAVRAIVERADGNPFFLEELTRVVTDHRRLKIDADLPATIQEVLMARIDRLSRGAKRLLQIASVAGRMAPLRLLTAMSDDGEALTDPLDELERAELVYEQRGDAGELAYVFKHALVQETAYASLLVARRQALHLKAAQTFERLYAERLEPVYDRLAFHYARTRATDKAIEYLSRLAERAARWYAHGDAVAALREARAHVEQLPDGADRQRTRVLLGLREASSLHFLGRFTEILELLLPQREVVDALGEPGLAGEFFVRLGRTYDVLGDHARAVESANRALEAARRCGDDAIAGKAEFVLAYVGYWSGRHRDGVAHGMRAVELLEKGDEHWWRGQAHWVVGVNQIVLAEYPAALASLERAGKIAGQIADRRLQSVVGWGTGAVHALAGDFATALVECTRAFEEAPDPLARAVAQGLLGGVYVEQGEPVAALPLLEESVRHLEHFRLRQTQGWYTTLLADAHLLAGNVDRARALATAGLETTVSVGFGFGMACAHRALARVETAAGAHAAAETHYRAAIAGFAAIGSRYEQARSHLELAELAVARHRAEIAREELDEARRLSADLPFDRYAARLTAVAAAIPSPPR